RELLNVWRDGQGARLCLLVHVNLPHPTVYKRSHHTTFPCQPSAPAGSPPHGFAPLAGPTCLALFSSRCSRFWRKPTSEVVVPLKSEPILTARKCCGFGRAFAMSGKREISCNRRFASDNSFSAARRSLNRSTSRSARATCPWCSRFFISTASTVCSRS